MKQNAGDHKCAWIENVKAKRKDINSCKFLKNLQEFYFKLLSIASNFSPFT